MRIAVPQAVEEIIETLTSYGYEAYAVGGCVRDSLLGREPGDWDITTSASPFQVKEVFRRTVDTGILHGTVTVMKNHVGYEVTTYRIDGEYEDGRHPKSVAFTSDLKEDLCRRDFTVNAVAYRHETGIVDIFGGMEDRFTEDALRILRAIRFSAQLGFVIEEKTRAAIEKIAPNLMKVSRERVQVELTKLLLSPHPEQIREVYDLGISPYVSAAFHRADIKNLCIPSSLPEEKAVRWSAFLKNEDREAVISVLKDLKMDNATIDAAAVLTQWIHREIAEDKAEIRRTMSQMEPELFDRLLCLRTCLGCSGTERLKELTGQIRQAGDCIYLKDLAVTGKDLLNCGMRPGKQVGTVLSGLLDEVLEHPEQNRKDVLLRRVFPEQG